ncbi:MAG: hypothetical protein Q4P24_07015 [Rhodobacterales bacterium]|nr:hypothetical protein [Rhodobacterales bacterium]
MERLDVFFSGAPIPPKRTDLDAGPSVVEVTARKLKIAEAALSVLDDLDDDTPAAPITAYFHFGADCDDHIIERIDAAPNPGCRYGKAFAQVRALEAQLAEASPDDTPHIAAELHAASATWDTEKARAFDDHSRKIHLIDTWRAGEGRDKYNATRRATDRAANRSLKDLTEQEREAHRAALARDRKWTARKKAAGWTAEQIAAGLALRIAKRTWDAEAI